MAIGASITAIRFFDGAKVMSDVTHAKCPRCSTYEPIVWRNIKVEQPRTDGVWLGFEGMEAVCRSCGFTVAELGSTYQRASAA